jgi:2-isopropylmalate synthase
MRIDRESCGTEIRLQSNPETFSTAELGLMAGADRMEGCLIGNGKPGDHYGVGLDTNIVTASIRAIVSGINRIQPDVAAVTDIRAA